MKEGWRCPVCGAVNAPWMPQCSCKGRVAFVSWPTYPEYPDKCDDDNKTEAIE